MKTKKYQGYIIFFLLRTWFSNVGGFTNENILTTNRLRRDGYVCFLLETTGNTTLLWLSPAKGHLDWISIDFFILLQMKIVFSSEWASLPIHFVLRADPLTSSFHRCGSCGFSVAVAQQSSSSSSKSPSSSLRTNTSACTGWPSSVTTGGSREE